MPTSARAGVVYFHDPVEWGNVAFLSHSPVPFNVPRGSMGFRADVGIGPYIRVGVRTIRRTLHQAHPNPTVSSAKALPGGAGQQKDSYKLKA